MFKRSFKPITAVCLSTLLLTSGVYASSATLEKQQRQMKQNQQNVQRSIEQNRTRAATVQKDVNAVQSQIIELDKKISSLAGNIYTLELEIDALNKDIAQKELDLAAKQEELKKTQALFEERVRAMYMNGKVDYIEVILNSKNIEDLLMNYKIVSSIADSDKQLVDTISGQIQAIDAMKKSLESNVVKMNSSKRQLEAEQSDLQAASNEKQTYMNALQSDVQAYNQAVTQMEAEWANLDQEILRLQNEITKAKAAERQALEATKRGARANSNLRHIDPSVRQGGSLSWPVPGHFNISSPFGYRIHPVYGYSKFHSGVDIPAPSGTPIIAAKDGVVIMAKSMSGYGNVVMIDHGDIVTVYAHNSVLKVVPGQSVKAGDVISLCGSTGVSTGPHLHFEVRVNGSAVDPLNFI
ncbi:peptidoglycan DD-metalloendopeptidase family protein [Peptoniphilus equinus]|uniref:Peptidoglycan DD-metalloendopeptidase family protein n=1 Tax=Peptoniphilus equinus TaxID=3016343 RepID=A0ABY7QU12_9FIRM|nr:peptidoglycan DD-metalloendopeptidase family protein [Peptoniphilus equinus]WBW49510.1 peptidoglycan DD-metalloendopeptidase family protein [Peptoniphilus equinus]